MTAHTGLFAQKCPVVWKEWLSLFVFLWSLLFFYVTGSLCGSISISRSILPCAASCEDVVNLAQRRWQ